MSEPDIRATPPVPPGDPSAEVDASRSAEPPAAPATLPHAGLSYAVLRLAMLVTVGGLLYLVGLRGWTLLFLAVLVSAIVSFFVFLRQREAAARALEESVEHWQARHHAHDESDEDERPSGS